MDSSGSGLALVGGIVILTFAFCGLPVIFGLVFFLWRRFKPPFYPSRLAPVALLAGLIQLILAGPILADVFDFIPSSIYPWKTLDYAGFSLLTGVILSISIAVLWFKSHHNRMSTDRSLTRTLTIISAVLFAFQLNAIHSYTVHNKENTNKFLQQQLALAEQMGTQIYKANSPKLGNLDLISDPFDRKLVYLGDGSTTKYTVVYRQTYTNEGSFGRYHMDQINIQTSDRADFPCTIDVDNSPVKEDCRHLGDSANGFAVYGKYAVLDIGRYKSGQPQLFDCTFQKGTTRIGISIFKKFSEQDCLNLAETLQEISPDQAIKKYY